MTSSLKAMFSRKKHVQNAIWLLHFTQLFDGYYDSMNKRWVSGGMALPLLAVPLAVWAGDLYSPDMPFNTLESAQPQSIPLSLSQDGRLSINVAPENGSKLQFSFQHSALQRTQTSPLALNLGAENTRDENSGEWDSTLNATNADQTNEFGLELERNAQNGTSGAVTFKTLFDDTQGAGVKLRVGEDTRALFGQYLRTTPDQVDENGSIALTLGYQEFDRKNTFNGEEKSDTLDAYFSALKYTHKNASPNAAWSSVYGEASYIDVHGPEFLVNGTQAGWPDMKEYRGEFGLVTSPTLGLELTPYMGTERTRTTSVDDIITTRNKVLGGFSAGLTWDQLGGFDNDIGTTSLGGERNSNNEWDAKISHTYEKWSLSARNSQSHEWAVSLGYNFKFEVPKLKLPKADTALRMDAVLRAAPDDQSPNHDVAQNKTPNVSFSRIRLSDMDFRRSERAVSMVADLASTSASVACTDTSGSPSQVSENRANLTNQGQTTTASITFSETIKSVDSIQFLNLGDTAAGGTISGTPSGSTVNISVVTPNVSPVKIRITVSDCGGNQTTYTTALFPLL